MALKHVALIFLALVLSSFHEIQARDSQMFNKIPSKTNEVVVDVKQPHQNLPNKEATDPIFNPDQQQDDEQNFIPENTENNYGLYGHESGQFSPTQIQNNNNQNFQTNPNPQNNFPYNAKYLPKNYNTVAYVTQPEDFNGNGYTTTQTNNNNYQNQENTNNNYNAQKKDVTNKFDFVDNEEDTSTYGNTNKYYNNEAYNNNKENNYYNNDVVSNNNNNFNTRFMDVSETTHNNNNNGNSYYNNDVVSNTNDNNFDTRFIDSSETSNNYYNNGKSRVNRVEPEGMSDTRFMENGKYHYDINSGKYSRDHPYMNSKAMRTQYNPTGYNDNDNSYQYNNYNEEEQYQNEDNMP